MQAQPANLLNFLRGPKQFIIPIYQRPYSWTTAQCQQLWDDIARVATDTSTPTHFIGSIVYIQDRVQLLGGASIPRVLVIDGQQRLTTITLLLAALRALIEEREIKNDSVTSQKIGNYYLFNPEEDGDLYYKLLLTESDKLTLTRLLKRESEPDRPSPRIKETYRFFEDQLRRSNVSPLEMYQGINKLLVVDIALERGVDNPQLIFESLNSTGLDLSQVDLIRNYILMDLPPHEQDDLYTTYWRPMEQRLALSEGSGLFDRFMRDYLTMQMGHIPKIGQVYTEFKQFVQARRPASLRPIVADLDQHSRHFARLALADDPDPSIRAAVQDINQLEVSVAYPFLMQVYNDYGQRKLSRDDFVQILRLIESYVFRRIICGIPANALNKIFASLYTAVEPSNYLNSLRHAFARLKSYAHFPNNEEFREQFAQRDVYSLQRTRSYLFRKLETHNHREPIAMEGLSIEHIMPQSIERSLAWQDMLGPNWREVHAQYLHTIGNLTLTGYNPDLSNRPFLEKRDAKPGGFADSHLRLNRGLATLDHWNEDTIKARAAELADLALKVWPGAGVTTDETHAHKTDKPETLTPAEMLGRVFRDPRDLQVASSLVRELVGILDSHSARHVLAVAFPSGHSINFTIGAWFVLYFARRKVGMVASFCFDHALYPNLEHLQPRRLDTYSARYSGGRDFRWVTLPFSHLSPLPEAFVEAWRAGVTHTAHTFKGWRASQSVNGHQPQLLDAFLDDKLVLNPTYFSFDKR
ncbi:MAG: DUF262 domain-containing protein [Anaerolineae bacterium]|nr:DUF262 domain-containing protein [Anaerolineae bacterium]